MSRNIIIYPNRGTTGATEQPYITFSGASAGSINLVVEDDGSLVFDGNTGSLFGISDNKDGLLHSVNDVSGLPIFQVYDDDRVVMGKWDEPTLTVSGQTWNVIIGSGNTINSGVLRSVVLGGGQITGTTSDTVFTPNLMVTGNEVIQTNLSSYPIGTLTAASTKGNAIIFDYNGSIGYGAYNISSSGSSLIQVGDVSTYPTEVKFGSFGYYGTGYTRAGSPPTGDYSWGNRVVLRALDETDGMVFNLAGVTNSQRTFAWDSAGESLMVLHANDGQPRLCIDCSPTDYDYKGDTTLQVGSTGNTASFKFVDGNQQDGYVLTSDSTGKATWQASTGGGGAFTATTSNNTIIPTNSGGNNITDVSTYSSILGGKTNNMDTSPYSVIGGGLSNTITGSSYTSIVGGTNNKIHGSNRSFIAGGSGNLMNTNSLYSSMMGSRNGTITDASISNIIGGNTNIISAATFSDIINGTQNEIKQTVTIAGGTDVDNNFIINGQNNKIHSARFSGIIGSSGSQIRFNTTYSGASTNNMVLGGSNHLIDGHTSSVILGGYSNTIAFDDISQNGILAGRNNTVIGGGLAAIVGGSGNTINGNPLSDSDISNVIVGGNDNIINTGGTSTILGGSNNILDNTTNSVIVGGQFITGTTNDTLFTPSIRVFGDEYIHSDDTSVNVGVLGDNKGGLVYFNHTGSTTWTVANNNISGQTSVGVGQLSTGKNVLLKYYGEDYIRNAVTPTNGVDFYQNKAVLNLGNNSDGLIFSLDAGANLSRLWFEENAESGMLIAGRGGFNELSLGIGLNPNGTEIPTAHLQIGGTGTTGTFRFLDGNQQSGYVMTSDVNGNVSWSAPTGGGGGDYVPTSGGTVTGDLVVSGTTNVNGNETIRKKAFQTLTSGTTVTWNVNNGINAEVTLGGNSTLDITNVQDGDYGTLIVIQDSVGSRTLALDGTYTNRVVNGGGGGILLTSTPNTHDIVTWVYNGGTNTMYWNVGNDYN